MSKLVQLKHVTDEALERSPHPPEAMGVWGRSTQPLGDFCNFWEKNDYFNAIWITFHVFRAIRNNKIFEISKPVEQMTPFTSIQVQNTFKI